MPLYSRVQLYLPSHCHSLTSLSWLVCCTVLFSNRWRCYELISCWNKWSALRSDSLLLTALSARNTDSLLKLKRRWTILLCCNFPCNHPRCENLVQTGLKRESDDNIKCEPEQKWGGEGAADLLPKESHDTASSISKCYPLKPYSVSLWFALCLGNLH